MTPHHTAYNFTHGQVLNSPERKSVCKLVYYDNAVPIEIIRQSRALTSSLSHLSNLLQGEVRLCFLHLLQDLVVMRSQVQGM